MMFRSMLMSFMAMAGCVEAGDETSEPEETPGPSATCATPAFERWTGGAGRVNQRYPDDVAADVTWVRVATSGCVDRFEPTGTVRYTFAVPGALCTQAMAPGEHAVGAADGTLTIDRSTSPATYVGRGATTWTVTWTCRQDDGVVDSQTFDAGGVWFDATGTIGARVEGARTEDDGRQCGRGQSTLPCDYTWAFDPAR